MVSLHLFYFLLKLFFSFSIKNAALMLFSTLMTRLFGSGIKHLGASSHIISSDFMRRYPKLVKYITKIIADATVDENVCFNFLPCAH